MRLFVEILGITPETRVIDIGGTLTNWVLCPVKPRLTIVNIQSYEGERPPWLVEWRVADGRHLPYDDNEFDVAFSNSVIEHVGGWDEQMCFANEVRRVASSYFVQTPDRNAFIEPHLLFPGIHWLPRSIGRYMAILTPSTILRGPAETIRIYDEVRLIGEDEMKFLFPDAQIRRERNFGVYASLIAIKRANPNRP